MNKKDNGFHDDDYHDVILGEEDKEIPERKPPNEKIIFFNIVKE